MRKAYRSLLDSYSPAARGLIHGTFSTILLLLLFGLFNRVFGLGISYVGPVVLGILFGLAVAIDTRRYRRPLARLWLGVSAIAVPGVLVLGFLYPPADRGDRLAFAGVLFMFVGNLILSYREVRTEGERR